MRKELAIGIVAVVVVGLVAHRLDRPPAASLAADRASTASRATITIGWVGDITLGSRMYGDPPGSGDSEFNAVRSLLRAPDLMIGNYEGTLSTGGSARCAPSAAALCFIFQAPPRNAGALERAGFDVLNLSNNHALDMGAAARTQTVRAIEGYRMHVTGLSGQITRLRVQGVRVAIVGFGFTQGTMLVRDLPIARTMVRRARHGADVVVVVMHAGIEGTKAAHVPYGDEDGRGDTRAFVSAVVAAGANVVFGSSPHVLRGVQQLDHRLAFYSTGNFAGWHNFAMGGASSQSAFVTVTLSARGATLSGRIVGLHLTGPGIPARDSSGDSLATMRMLSREDFGSTAARIAPNGRITMR